jgi:hypothetical protein
MAVEIRVRIDDTVLRSRLKSDAARVQASTPVIRNSELYHKIEIRAGGWRPGVATSEGDGQGKSSPRSLRKGRSGTGAGSSHADDLHITFISYAGVTATTAASE